MPEPVNSMSEEAANTEAERLIATAFRDDSPVPAIGDAPPVPQPGRPPMSAKAVDDTARMIGASVVIATTGGSTTAILWASGYANPAVVAIVFGAPTALVLAIARLAKRARPEPEVHQHFHGNVTQTTTHSKNTGLWAKTNHK
ncbi:hypothetical protein [Streptomyces sp. NPDC057115]|uniref:hypothetical protein n=1 Tax=Streptomyces sp. NPDC057115 TaxID=3346022 RepID=UPI003625FD97